MPLADFLHRSWRKHLEQDLGSDYFSDLESFVASRRKEVSVYPSEEDTFTWSHLCPLESVNVVIIGQDPYYRANQAHGLCFSVRKGSQIEKLPPSLQNILEEVKYEFGDKYKQPKHGDLSEWAKQGVLMLNATLTVEDGKPNSHKDIGWKKFTDAAIRLVNERHKHVVYMLWGDFAQKKKSLIDLDSNLVLQTSHPAPYSVNEGFKHCGHFKEANEYLEKHEKQPIDWCRFD